MLLHEVDGDGDNVPVGVVVADQNQRHHNAAADAHGLLGREQRALQHQVVQHVVAVQRGQGNEVEHRQRYVDARGAEENLIQIPGHRAQNRIDEVIQNVEGGAALVVV